MGSTSKLCEIADAGPLVHTMSWEEIGQACGDASLRIAELEAALTNAIDLLLQPSFRAVPGSDDERQDYDATVSQGRKALYAAQQ